MDHQLVTEEIEVNPMITASAFCAIEDVTIKGSAFIQVVYGDGDMKRRDLGHSLFGIGLQVQNH